MAACRDRSELIEQVGSHYDLPQFRELREKLATAYRELDDGNFADGERLLEEIGRSSRKHSKGTASLRVGTKFYAKANGTVGIEPSVEVTRRPSERETLSDLLFRERETLSWSDYEREAARLFPEPFQQ